MLYDELKGQDELRLLLDAAIRNNRLSHAVMLVGAPGSGKTSWGKLLAQAILCLAGGGLKPCMVCSSCQSFLQEEHPDYYYLAPEKKELKTEQFKNVRERFYLGGTKKVCLIDQAETMTAAMASSLLKILEEPPSGLTFILLVSQPRSVFDTILSRCSRYFLLPLECAQVYELLEKSGQAQGEKAEMLAHLSEGLPGYAFKMAADEDFDERLKEAKDLAYNLAVAGGSLAPLLSQAENLAAREDLVLLLELLVLIYRDALRQNLCSEESLVVKIDGAFAWTEAVDPGKLEEAVLLLNKAIFSMVKTNVNRRLLLEKTFVVLRRRFA